MYSDARQLFALLVVDLAQTPVRDARAGLMPPAPTGSSSSVPLNGADAGDAEGQQLLQADDVAAPRTPAPGARQPEQDLPPLRSAPPISGERAAPRHPPFWCPPARETPRAPLPLPRLPAAFRFSPTRKISTLFARRPLGSDAPDLLAEVPAARPGAFTKSLAHEDLPDERPTRREQRLGHGHGSA